MLLVNFNLILKVAEFRSITAAAESLDMRTATASAAIKRVECLLTEYAPKPNELWLICPSRQTA
jgi:molybdenum-dependent DNA-binding transcriptional regulator ModE